MFQHSKPVLVRLLAGIVVRTGIIGLAGQRGGCLLGVAILDSLFVRLGFLAGAGLFSRAGWCFGDVFGFDGFRVRLNVLDFNRFHRFGLGPGFFRLGLFRLSWFYVRLLFRGLLRFTVCFRRLVRLVFRFIRDVFDLFLYFR